MRVSARAVVIRDKQLLVMERNKFGDHYLSLLGGALEADEQPVDAAKREVMEESTIVISNPRLIILEDAGEVFGQQYIYLCDYVSGEPKLGLDSIEYKINAGGKNLYNPTWLDIETLAMSNLQPHELKDTLVSFIKDGFPDKPIELKIASDSKL